MPQSKFRRYLFPPGHPRIEDVKGLDAYAYREAARTPGTFTGGLIEGWTPLYKNDFRGVTNDGVLREGLFRLEPAAEAERAPAAEMVRTAEVFLGLLDNRQREAVQYGVDAVEWQTWANPEFMQFDNGLRLEFVSSRIREAALDVVKASLSEYGYGLARAMMRINGFLGDVVGLPGILNEFSYNFSLFGTPDEREPWGWQLYGHHCAVNCFVVDGQMVVSPIFFGAEPSEIDEGEHAGTGAFTERIDLARRLMASLPKALREQAVTYRQMVDPAMPEGRVHSGDERHLAGAFQDNRVIPYEGILVSSMPAESVELLTALVNEYVRILPEGPRRARLRQVQEHYGETWFSWIGGHGPEDVFYFRIQSPVAIFELDHHCGVFLDYDEPKDFHIHTVMRTPNGNDYGRELLRQWQQARVP